MPLATVAVVVVLIIFALSHWEITSKPGMLGARLTYGLIAGVIIFLIVRMLWR
jgi:hypothetical protein